MNTPLLRKPDWIRIKLPTNGKVNTLKATFKHQVHTVCEEASCPNLNECFTQGTASFLILGNQCTRRCPFCNISHGQAVAIDADEPFKLAHTIQAMHLKYVVITSVTRDDLRDGGAGHFVACIQAIRDLIPHIRIEILVPDFRGRMERALTTFKHALPEVFNHNLETIASLYQKTRPGADYKGSLQLLKRFKACYPDIPTKSGLMLGLGETFDEVLTAMTDLRHHHCDLLTLGQYLQPSLQHLPVQRYITPKEFDRLAEYGQQMGFKNVTSGPLVRSSYQAERQASL